MVAILDLASRPADPVLPDIGGAGKQDGIKLISQPTDLSQRPPRYANKSKNGSPPCVSLVCCEADHGDDGSLAYPAAVSCGECPSSCGGSPRCDDPHITHACPTATWAATSSSTSPSSPCAASAACCDAGICSNAQASSSCDVSTCDPASPCVVASTICCTDERCEADERAEICDGIVRHDEPCDSRKSHEGHCPDCLGSIGLGKPSSIGNTYDSFQEFLDCCCCSMPTAADHHNIGPDTSRQLAHQDGSQDEFSGVVPVPVADSVVRASMLPLTTTSASTDSSVVKAKPTNFDPPWSPSSSESTAATLPPNCASDHKHMIAAVNGSVARPSRPGGVGKEPSSFIEEILGQLESWESCNFAQPHLHNTQGVCLPPKFSLCESTSCSTTAPHSHWLSPANSMDVSDTPALQDARPQACQWAGCKERFWTVEELVAHVNFSHLSRSAAVPHGSSTDASPSATTDSQQLSLLSQPPRPVPSVEPLSCLWDDCHQVADPSLFIAQSEDISPNGSNVLKDKVSFFMLQHLLQDHLGGDASGLNDVYQSLDSDPQKLQDEGHRYQFQETSKREKTVSPQRPPLKRQCPSSSCDSTEDGVLHCCWEGCSEVFPSHCSLTDHIANVHVGSGKNEYECRWIGCERNAEGRKFTQKQKVMRHIQTHTGDRPHRCDLCGKRFSEPNTLAQHMRTHTQEKPYVCDYPGCGKAFSVAGSLTIHKRIHSGSKPFVCAFPGCGKAFSESSNLTKHMRIHTGDKPFRCEVCGKCFSRPDQASRHRKTHERKAKRKKEFASHEDGLDLDSSHHTHFVDL